VPKKMTPVVERQMERKRSSPDAKDRINAL